MPAILTRRAILGAGACVASATLIGAARSFRAMPVLPAPPRPGLHGPLSPPIDLPDVTVTMQDGSVRHLASLARGHATALQLMFTECSATCPIGAATFMQVQAMIPDQIRRGIQLLSLDMGPFGNTPSALRVWLDRFHAGPGWLAAVPNPVDLPALQTLFGLGSGPGDPHSTQIQIIGRSGQLVWRTYEMPSAEDITSILTRA